VSPRGSAQAALVGIVVTNEFEVFFDTMAESRKVANLRHDPRIAFVIGGTALGDERTLQYEGIADEPTGADLRRLKGVYLERFPDGRDRQSWPGITYISARPTWIRYSDFNRQPAAVIEFSAADLDRSSS
jgi:general stress protein 26